MKLLKEFQPNKMFGFIPVSSETQPKSSPTLPSPHSEKKAMVNQPQSKTESLCDLQIPAGLPHPHSVHCLWYRYENDIA